MNKDAFYFPHFCNARHDRKIKRLRKELGLEGYGIYFMLLETLREQLDFKYPMNDIDLLAEEFGTSEQKIRVTICNYQLFDIDEFNSFFSIKLIEYLEPYFKMKLQRQNAVKSRWDKVNKTKQLSENNDTNVIRPYYESDTDVIQSKVKESKIKEIKESKVNNNNIEFDFSFVHKPIYESVIEFVDYRKTVIKKPIKTQKQLETWYKLLRKYANGSYITAIEIIDTAIANGWQGIVEPKQKPNYQKPNEEGMNIDELLRRQKV